MTGLFRLACGASARRVVSLSVATLAAVASAAGGDTACLSADVAATLRALARAASHPDLAWSRLDDVGGELARVYEATDYAPVWIRDGAVTPQARAAIDYLAASHTRGLTPADYEPDRLVELQERLVASGDRAAAAARFDTALTVALLRLLRHTEHGRIDPRRVGFGIDITQESVDLPAVVLAISTSADVASEIDSLQPAFPLFGRLLVALARYRALTGCSDLDFPATPALRPGDVSPACEVLRTCLQALGDLQADAPLPANRSLYDDRLVEAVKRFQRRHGLDIDGVVGRETRAALQVPPAQRAVQIEWAIERLRWLPRRPPERYLIVNIPAFRLLVFERGVAEPMLISNVIVGSAARRYATPMLISAMERVVFRPYWHIPPRILRNEILPRVRADPEYLTRHDMEWAGGGIRQRPGPNNALGLVKFVFPNPFHVYLHDTPARVLFARSRRDFSHGCIRVERAIDLAELVLRGQEGWTRERIVAAMQRGPDNQQVPVTRPLAVYVLYSTAIVTVEGEVWFFADIYGHDARLQQALAKGPPYS